MFFRINAFWVNYHINVILTQCFRRVFDYLNSKQTPHALFLKSIHSQMPFGLLSLDNILGHCAISDRLELLAV